MEKEDYSWCLEFHGRWKIQDYYERFGLNAIIELDEEWNDGIPPELKELIDWYKKWMSHDERNKDNKR